MLKRLLTAMAVSLPIGVLALAPTASAATVTSGAYSQTTSSFSCRGVVHEDGDGGIMSVRVRGGETRPENRHFRTAYVKTRLIAQERTYDGTWKTVEYGTIKRGYLGATRDLGAYNFAPLVWNGSTNPRFAIEVAGHDDLFRVRVATRFYDDEHVLLTRLVTTEGSCRL